MIFVETQNLNEEQKRQIFDLWNKEYPKKLSHSELADFDRYLDGIADKHHILLFDECGTVKGWLMYFIRNEERWFALILDSSIQRQGWGSKILDRAKKITSTLNGWVIDNNTELKQDGNPYQSPVEFYKKNGFRILSGTRLTLNSIDGIKIVWKNDTKTGLPVG